MPQNYTLLTPARLQRPDKAAVNYLVPIHLGAANSPIDFAKLNTLIGRVSQTGCHPVIILYVTNHYDNRLSQSIDMVVADWLTCLDTWRGEHPDSALARLPNTAFCTHHDYKSRNEDKYNLAHFLYQQYSLAEKNKKRVEHAYVKDATAVAAVNADISFAHIEPYTNQLYETMILDILTSLPVDKAKLEKWQQHAIVSKALSWSQKEATVCSSLYALPHSVADMMRKVGEIGYQQKALIIDICHFQNEQTPTIYRMVSATKLPVSELTVALDTSESTSPAAAAAVAAVIPVVVTSAIPAVTVVPASSPFVPKEVQSEHKPLVSRSSSAAAALAIAGQSPAYVAAFIVAYEILSEHREQVTQVLFHSADNNDAVIHSLKCLFFNKDKRLSDNQQGASDSKTVSANRLI